MHIDLLWAFFLIYVIDSVTPGPAVAMVMSRGASIGLIRTLPFIFGLVAGDLLLFVFALSGLVALAKSLGPLFLVIKWIGIAYLLYLAYTMWNANYNESSSADSGGAGWRSFVFALFIPLGNPKAVGFYVALLPAFMDVGKLSVNTALYFCLVIIAVWSSVLVVYTALAAKGRQYLGESCARKWLNRSSAGAMVGAAGIVAFRH